MTSKKKHAPVKIQKRTVIAGLVFGFLLGSALVTGRFLDLGQELTGANILKILLYSVEACIPLALVFCLAAKFLPALFTPGCGERRLNNRALFFLDWAGLFLAWLPVFLAFYPGIAIYDSYYQLSQSLGSYSTWHPLAHTLLLQAIYSLGADLSGANLGIALNALFQMILFSASLAYLMLVLHRRRIRKWICWAQFVLMAVMPIYSVMAISINKDLIFTPMLLVFCLCLTEIERDAASLNSREIRVLFIVSAAGVWLFRNNGKYALLLVLAVGAVHFLRQDRALGRRFCRLAALSLLIAVGISLALFYFTGAARSTANEMLSIPYQQVSRVYITEQASLTSEEKQEISDFVPYVYKYKPQISDPVKDQGTAPDDPKGFAKLYFSLLKKYPGRYLEALLITDKGYWDPLDTTSASVYGSDLSIGKGFFEFYIQDGLNAVRESQFPALENLYLQLFCLNGYLNIPILRPFLSLGLYMWLIALALFAAIAGKRRQAATPLTLILGLLLTTLAGPCAIVRYTLPYVVCLPALNLSAFSVQKRTRAAAADRSSAAEAAQ